MRVFFDLNGEPRTIVVPDRLKAGEIKVRAKAAPGDAKQVNADLLRGLDLLLNSLAGGSTSAED